MVQKAGLTTPDLGLCEVCEKNPAIGVASCCAVPYSARFCASCAQAGGEPWFIIVANTAIVGWENAADFWKEVVRQTCMIKGRTMDQFHADVAKCKEDLDEHDRKQAEDRSASDRQEH